MGWSSTPSTYNQFEAIPNVVEEPLGFFWVLSPPPSDFAFLLLGASVQSGPSPRRIYSLKEKPRWKGQGLLVSG